MLKQCYCLPKYYGHFDLVAILIIFILTTVFYNNFHNLRIFIAHGQNIYKKLLNLKNDKKL